MKVVLFTGRTGLLRLPGMTCPTSAGLELGTEALGVGCMPVNPVSIPADPIRWDSVVVFGRAPWHPRENVSAPFTVTELLTEPLSR